MSNLNARERRLVAIALLLLLLAAIWLGAISPLINGFVARQAERQALLSTFRRDQRLLDGIPVWLARAEAQKREAADFAFAAPSQLQAQDLLKQRLAAAMSAAGATPPAVQDVQADLPAGWIGARADAALTLTQLTESLRRLESEKPYVVVEYFSVGAERAGQSGHAGPLDVRLELSAPFRLAGSPQP